MGFNFGEGTGGRLKFNLPSVPSPPSGTVQRGISGSVVLASDSPPDLENNIGLANISPEIDERESHSQPCPPHSSFAAMVPTPSGMPGTHPRQYLVSRRRKVLYPQSLSSCHHITCRTELMRTVQPAFAVQARH